LATSQRENQISNKLGLQQSLIVSFFDPWNDPKASQRTWGTVAELDTCGCAHLMLVEALWRAFNGFFPIDIVE
jgi:hypothetical protein